jgi:hypothetical protein
MSSDPRRPVAAPLLLGTISMLALLAAGAGMIYTARARRNAAALADQAIAVGRELERRRLQLVPRR